MVSESTKTSICSLSTVDMWPYSDDIGGQNLTSENQLKLAMGQKDEGSSYFELTCSGCHNTIGRYYKSTTDYSDAYRDKFALYMDKVTTYSLGSCNQNSRDDSSVASCGILVSLTPVDPNSILLSFDAERARNDALALKEIKSIILHLNQRLSALESSHSSVVSFANKGNQN